MPSPSSIYFILVDHGPKIGHSWIERDPAQMDWQSTVDDISSGEITGMIEVRRAEDWTDVTREIALAVSTLWSHESLALDYERYRFVEMHLGTRAARSFICEVA